ncbi:MAG: hypothetical protein EOO38_03435 [Cytophagaceae bacterium]|nr:MAG: hypothetical protein EOO38_03435 [Cytophagaceae bacterium]
MQTPRPADKDIAKQEAIDDKPLSLPKDSPMDGFEQQTTVTVTTKTTPVKSSKAEANIDPSKPTLLLVDDNVSRTPHHFLQARTNFTFFIRQ